MKIKKSIFCLFACLIIGIILVTPVLAKTKTEVKAIQMGSLDFSTAEKVLETPNEKILHYWGIYGDGIVSLTQSDGTTVIDTFISISDSNMKITDSTTMGFADGVLNMKSTMNWVSDTVDGGFEGIIHFRRTYDSSNIEMKGVYQGYGEYAGQTLKLEGIIVMGVGQVYDGILIA